MRMRGLLLLLLAVAVGVSVACDDSGSDASGRPEVVTAFYPLTFLVDGIGGANVHIDDLTPAGVEPHDLEMTAGQVRDLADADLVVLVGGGFQPALEDAVEQVDVDILDVLEGQDLVEGGEEDGTDPHVWLDPVRMIDMARSITEALSGLDPEHAGAYEEAAGELEDDLTELDREFSTGLADCERREIVTSHEAFGYLAARYGLEQIGIAGIDPESEPSPARLAEVADFARENDVTTIFFEELAPPDIAETLAGELGIETAVLNPLESGPETGDYLTEMRANLEALRDALSCG
jgi:zinc transport system substrate-binding protein